jgi:hypothetical protein
MFHHFYFIISFRISYLNFLSAFRYPFYVRFEMSLSHLAHTNIHTQKCSQMRINFVIEENKIKSKNYSHHIVLLFSFNRTHIHTKSIEWFTRFSLFELVLCLLVPFVCLSLRFTAIRSEISYQPKERGKKVSHGKLFIDLDICMCVS